MSSQLICPLCPTVFEEPVVYIAPKLADVFGITPETLASIHHSQNLSRLEHDLERHLKTHTLIEWVTALHEAREEARQLREQLAHSGN